jgi:hypothetical protein
MLLLLSDTIIMVFITFLFTLKTMRADLGYSMLIGRARENVKAQNPFCGRYKALHTKIFT